MNFILKTIDLRQKRLRICEFTFKPKTEWMNECEKKKQWKEEKKKMAKKEKWNSNGSGAHRHYEYVLLSFFFYSTFVSVHVFFLLHCFHCLFPQLVQVNLINIQLLKCAEFLSHFRENYWHNLHANIQMKTQTEFQNSQNRHENNTHEP